MQKQNYRSFHVGFSFYKKLFEFSAAFVLKWIRDRKKKEKKKRSKIDLYFKFRFVSVLRDCFTLF